MGLKSIFTGLCFLTLASGCLDETDCAAVGCFAQTISLELIDNNGTNLIANGTYELENIVVLRNSNKVNLSSPQTTTEIIFFVTGNKGNNTYEIQLNSNETDILVLNQSIDSPGGKCCPASYLINSANYNGASQQIIRTEFKGSEKLIITKP